MARLLECLRARDGEDDPFPSLDARMVLPPGTLFVDIAVSDAKIVVLMFFGPEESMYGYTLDLDARRVESISNEFYDSIARRPVGASARIKQVDLATRYGRELFCLLFYERHGKAGKALDLIRRAKGIIISPSGPLLRVPFGALVVNTEGPPRYLGLEKAVSYAPSLMFLVRQWRLGRPAEPTPGNALIVGDPASTADSSIRSDPADSSENLSRGSDDTSDESAELGCRCCLYNDLAPLPGARCEAEDVARLYHIRPVLGSEATEAEIRRRIVHASVIHFANHFCFCPIHPGSSALLLANRTRTNAPDDPTNDGRLELREVADGLRLQANVVVLANCSSGVETRVPGLGALSMASAMLLAGARSVVATQWPVNDQVSSKVMTSFHAELRRGTPKAEALRKAVKAALDRDAALDPYYWAGFVLLGDYL